MQFEFQAATTVRICKEKKIYTLCRRLFLNSITNLCTLDKPQNSILIAPPVNWKQVLPQEILKMNGLSKCVWRTH